MFYVAMSKKRPGCGKASCVDDPNEKALIREFFTENSGHEIRHVNGDEMVRLMTIEPPDLRKEAGQ
jgi:hypothetical protein